MCTPGNNHGQKQQGQYAKTMVHGLHAATLPSGHKVVVTHLDECGQAKIPQIGDDTSAAAQYLGDMKTKTWKQWLLSGVLALMIILGLRYHPSVIPFIIIVFACVVPLEKLFPRHDQPLRRRGIGTDITYAIVSPLLAPLAAAVAILIGVLSLAWLPGLLIRHEVALLPAGVKAIVGFLLFDMATYWAHRWSHEVPLLWRFHSVHHSSEQMDWASGIRSHPFDGAVLAVPIAFLIGAGFSFKFSIIITALKVVTGLLLHANVRWRWHTVRGVIISPEFHHWHHSSERDAINRNYSTFLPIWDVVFGTYFMPSDRRPEVYGAKPAVPDGILAQLAHPFKRRPTPLQPAVDS